MLHIRLFMESEPHTMPAKFAHHGVAVLVGMTPNRLADFVDKMPRFGSGSTDFETLLGYTHQALLFGSCLADNKHAGGIAIVAIENG